MPWNKILLPLSNRINTGEKMPKISNQPKNNQIITDDLAFSAYLKLQGYNLIKSNGSINKKSFVFDIRDQNAHDLKMEFINSECLNYYNQLRNMKKLL